MAYDPKAENLRHLRRIVTDLFDFSGRSQRTEFIVFLGVAMIIGMLVLIVSQVGLDGPRFLMNSSVQLALWILAIPLFVRRLHDQDRSGWFALIIPAFLAYRAYELILFDAGQLPLPDLGFPYNIVAIALVIAFWALVCWPGTDGENRFGPDPRIGEHEDVR